MAEDPILALELFQVPLTSKVAVSFKNQPKFHQFFEFQSKNCEPIGRWRGEGGGDISLASNCKVKLELREGQKGWKMKRIRSPLKATPSETQK